MSYNFTQEDMSDFIDSVSTENDYVINFPKDIGSIKSQKRSYRKILYFLNQDLLLKKYPNTIDAKSKWFIYWNTF